MVTLIESFEGKNLNSPNDVVVKSDGSIWFTDPDYGLAGRTKEQPGNYVYRFDPKNKTATAVIKDFDKPNGLAFSPDETKLYVADSGKPKHIRVFDVAKDGAVSNGRIFASIDKGGPDGIRCDAAGRVWSSSGTARRSSPQMASYSRGFFCRKRLLISPSAARMGDGYS